jgi:hypothetical protein
MLNRTRFNLTKQEPFVMCVFFTFAKAVDALTNGRVKYTDVFHCLYQYTQNKLCQHIIQHHNTHDLMLDMNRSVNLFSQHMEVKIDHSFFANCIFPELKRMYPDIGIEILYPTCFADVDLVTKECVLCYPFHSDIFPEDKKHSIAVAYDCDFYAIDPNLDVPFEFNKLSVIYVGSDHFSQDCLLLSSE